MKRKSLIVFLSIILLSFCTSVFGKYVIDYFEIANIQGEEVLNDDDYFKVTFESNSEVGVSENKILYVKSGDTVSLKDAPKTSSSNGYIKRTDNKSNTLSLDEGFDKTIVVSSSLTFSATNIQVTTSTNVNDILVFDSSKGHKGSKENYGVDGGRNRINLKEGSNNNGSLVNYCEFNPNLSVIKDANINMSIYMAHSGKEVNESDWPPQNDKTYSDAVNNDTTITLEDNNSTESEYKPLSGNSDNKNYCVSRIELSRDVLLLNTYIAIGARNGCYGNNPSYFQINFQNFIVGPYTELDLNGHYLTIGQNSEIWAVGSITNSKHESGGLIVESGGNLETTFTVEDHNHEQSLPVKYLGGDTAFSMYRCPYFNVNTYFYPGCNFQLGLHMFLGPSQGDVYQEINLIGGKNPIFELKSGHIERLVKYDEKLIEVCGSNNFETNNMIYQRIEYHCYNFDTTIEFPTIQLAKLASIFDINIKLGKDNFYIPPYFSFYLNDCNVTLENNIVFFPGSYLYVDQNSSITLTHGNVEYVAQSGETALTLSETRTFYQNVGGLNFLIEMADYDEGKKWYDAGDNSGGSNGGDSAVIFQSADNFWKYLNNHRPAKCDFYGNLFFNHDVNNMYLNYSLGGNINFYNYTNLLDETKNLSKINFYSNNFQAAISRMNGLSLSNVRLNIYQYYFAPLISFGKVITNPEQPNQLIGDPSNKEIVFDVSNGLIIDKDNNLEYAFMFIKNGSINYSINHLNKSGYKRRLINNEDDYIEGDNDLLGNIYQVTFDDKKMCINSSNNSFQGDYVYFHGMFVGANITVTSSSVSANLNLSKFRKGGSYNGDISSRSAVFKETDSWYDHSAWRLA